MEDKYYTPSIEEFHVGFECEFKNNVQSNVFENTISNVDLIQIVFDHYEHEEYKGEFANTFRVKYLDKDDIESFGFKEFQKAACNWYLLEGRFEDGFASYGYWKHIRLLHDVGRNKVALWAYEHSLEEEETVLFQGQIKNKSELKKLIKQLNILQ